MQKPQTHPLEHVGLLIIGDEILLGRRQDKHIPRAVEYFAGIDVDMSWIYILGDDFDLLVEHFTALRQRGDDCFCFGGIGATPDDLTRQAVARACGVEVVRHPEAVRLIEHQFGEEAYPNRILMAELPQGAELIPNAYNNIPGFSCGSIHCLPGFPEMAWPMLEWVVKHRYETADNPHNVIVSLTVVGARESELIGLLSRGQKRFDGVKFSSLPRFPQQGVWQIELGLRGTREQVEAARSYLLAEIAAAGFEVLG